MERYRCTIDDPLRARVYENVLATPGTYSSLTPVEQRLARMLFFTLWPDGGGFTSYDEGLRALAAETASSEELRQIVDLTYDQTRRTVIAMPGVLAATGLHIHARYSREEVLAALDRGTLEKKPAYFQEGVLHTTVAGQPVDAFFITLKKSEADYSPTTLYRDYPISPTLFHWESQSTTTADSPTGRRYRDGFSTILLFVRAEKTGDFGTEPYTFLGPATYVSHTGEKPMAITWRLSHAMPADFFADTAIAT